jgi:hypothetical protein
MAQFPQGYRSIDARCNAAERRVLHQLRRCLEDDYLIWHDLPIGPHGRRPDFVILSPRWGVLLLEVKDRHHAALPPADPHADPHADSHVVQLDTAQGGSTDANPLHQVRDVTLELVDLMQHDPALVRSEGAFAGKLLCPYGWGVAFAGLRRSDVADSNFHKVFAEHRMLLHDDLDETVEPAAFQQRLWGMFTVHYPHTLTLAQHDRVRWHLFPDMRLQPLQVMDLQQEQIARSLGEGHHVIHGAAGSGKTMILLHRAQQLATVARADKPVLVLCCNLALADHIEAQLRQRGVDEHVLVRTFHSWCQDMVRSCRLDVPVHASGDAFFEALAHTVERAVEQGRVPGGQYSAVLIDEAHDFKDAWLRMAARMVDPATSSLLLLYDDAQSIFQKKRRKFNFADVGIEARGRTSLLKLNYRNTAEVTALALHCAQPLLDAGLQGGTGSGSTRPRELSMLAKTDNGNSGDISLDDKPHLVWPASAGRHGPLPVLVLARHGVDEARLVVDRIVAALASGVPADQIGVLCRARYLLRPVEQELARLGVACQSMNAQGVRHADGKPDAVRLLTLHNAKGLEFSLCCVVGLQALPMPGEALDDALRLVYVGMTRARHELLLSAHGSSPIVERVRLGMAALQQQFGTPAEADATLVSPF